MKRCEKKISQSSGTDFQKAVWNELCQIKKGEIITYSDLAKRVGRPKATRAVASAVGKNPFAPGVPCHRVIRSDGGIGGYSALGGVSAKRRLLKKEGITID